MIQLSTSLLAKLISGPTLQALLIVNLVLLFSNFHSPQQAKTTSNKTGILCVHITNLRNKSGQLHIAVFSSHDSFIKEKPLITKSLYPKPSHCDTLTIYIQLPEGEYGISVLDDSNNDSILNYGFAGIPLEGFGFSGYKLRGLKKPHFTKFSFHLKNGTTTDISVRMTYLF